MKPQVGTWVLTGALALAVLGPAAAQQRVAPVGLPSITPYTGLLTPYGYRPPSVPTDTIIPYSFIAYPVPQAVYVPVAVTPPQPAVQRVQVAIVTLRAGAAVSDLRVKRDTVVTWVNAGERERTFVVDPQRLSGFSAGATRQSGAARPNSSFSLAFHQPGTYQYFLQDQPERTAKITVEE
jgi:plastocyanin